MTNLNSFIVINEQSLRVGAVNKEIDGWRFIPWMDSHKSSRKGHETREKAIPRWVGSYTLEEAKPNPLYRGE